MVKDGRSILMDFSEICCKSVLCPECPFKMGNYRRIKTCYNGKSRKKLTGGKHKKIKTPNRFFG